MAEPKKILVVENDPKTRETLAEALTGEGHQVTTVSSAPAALAALQATEFDLLVTNYYLGGATGTWLARIATDSARVSIPRVLLVSELDREGFLAEVDAVFDGGPRAHAEPAQRISLTLYCNGSLRSQRARKRLTAILKRYDPAQVGLTIVDVASEDAAADVDRVVATPTIVRNFPGPRVWIAGDLEQDSAVRRMLDQAGVDSR